MSEVITKRLLTDDTGQSIVSALTSLISAVKPTAAEMEMSSTDTSKVKDVIEEQSTAIANLVKVVTLEKTVNNGYFTIDVSTDIGSGYSIASINTVYKSGITTDQLNLCYTIAGNVVYVRTGSGNQLANGTIIKILVLGIK